MKVKREHLVYLDMLKAQGAEPDHTYLMQAFSVTKKHARAIIQHWQNTVTEYQDAMFDAGTGYGR